MTGEEWLRMVNQLAEKTKAGKLAWSPAGGGGLTAPVRDQFSVHLAYVALNVKQQIQPRPDSLVLTLLGEGGQKIAVLTEKAMGELSGQAGVLALRRLFEVVVAKPRQQSLDDFRDALTEL